MTSSVAIFLDFHVAFRVPPPLWRGLFRVYGHGTYEAYPFFFPQDVDGGLGLLFMSYMTLERIRITAYGPLYFGTNFDDTKFTADDNTCCQRITRSLIS